MSATELALTDRLVAVENRYEELTAALADPALIANQVEYQRHVKEHARLGPVVAKYREYKQLLQGVQEAEEMLGERLDDDFRELVRSELEQLRSRLEATLSELKTLLVPRDPNDEKNVVIEVRAGTGGDEAGLFAADLARMYQRYAERMGWRTEVMSMSENEAGGLKEIIFVVEGDGAYSRLKFESGVHRVQRVPETEAQGRIHTSTATVAVLPEAEEVDVQIDPKDLQIDTFRSGGAGGQHVNKTESAIRITHLPTGIVVISQDERSQLKNREKGMRVLRARLYEHFATQAKAAETAARRSQVGTGDRSEKIRTYNFPQNRVTDHRIGLTLHKLELIMDGDIGELLDALITADQAERLKGEP